jgi:hypothetical protein
METKRQEQQLEVSRSAVNRLVSHGNKHRNDCVEGSYSAGYWDGYIRALQHVLEAENE